MTWTLTPADLDRYAEALARRAGPGIDADAVRRAAARQLARRPDAPACALADAWRLVGRARLRQLLDVVTALDLERWAALTGDRVAAGDTWAD